MNKLKRILFSFIGVVTTGAVASFTAISCQNEVQKKEWESEEDVALPFPIDNSVQCDCGAHQPPAEVREA
ncbi:hypothetical protein [Mycoplasmopsis iners]|uniref:hypothetical protein n=1 Tax=Mycoplasmopsis iners TaxID=76630 RepID=UPI0004981C5E|nr:hypothetical protein [Mycoplasmopsis iners]